MRTRRRRGPGGGEEGGEGCSGLGGGEDGGGLGGGGDGGGELGAARADVGEAMGEAVASVHVPALGVAQWLAPLTRMLCHRQGWRRRARTCHVRQLADVLPAPTAAGLVDNVRKVVRQAREARRPRKLAPSKEVVRTRPREADHGRRAVGAPA